MSIEKTLRKAKLAVSIAQESADQIPDDLINRVTALEMYDQEIDNRVSSIEDIITGGHSGSVVVITGVDFTAQSTTTKTITISNGIVTGVS